MNALPNTVTPAPTDALAPGLTIGALAALAGVHVETIRFYQRRDLLPEPERPRGGIRRYGAAEVSRVRFIKAAQRIGFSLDEVAELLELEDGTNCALARVIAERKLADVRERLADLARMETALADMVGRCAAGAGQVSCPLIASLHEAA
jgi:MerR family transcriptional regulator, mercuric resistance operon regulatory protein